MTASEWKVYLSDEARGDYLEILDWTAERFGERQANAYEALLIDVIDTLKAGPDIPGTRRRSDLGNGIISLRMTRKGSHVLFLRANEAKRWIEVFRILHDAMDFARHVKQGKLD